MTTMSAHLKHAYKTVLSDLLSAREFAGGSLCSEHEAALLQLLDELWKHLDPGDQQELEQQLMRHTA